MPVEMRGQRPPQSTTHRLCQARRSAPSLSTNSDTYATRPSPFDRLEWIAPRIRLRRPRHSRRSSSPRQFPLVEERLKAPLADLDTSRLQHFVSDVSDATGDTVCGRLDGIVGEIGRSGPWSGPGCARAGCRSPTGTPRATPHRCRICSSVFTACEDLSRAEPSP